MNPAFVTFSYGNNDDYTKLGLLLSNKFKENNFDVFVLTDQPELFDGFNIIPYHPNKFSYQHKILGVEHIYKLGYDSVLYIDSDIILFNDNFFNELSNIKFNDGITYTRHGETSLLFHYLEQDKNENFKLKIQNLNLDINKIPSIFEDVLYFKFDDKSELFFKYYHEVMNLKHQSDIETNWHRYGDQEGYTIAIACELSKTNYQITNDFYKLIHNLLARNYTYDGQMKTIMSQVDFIFPYRYDSEERKNNLYTSLSYYKKHFPNSNFIISEQGVNQTVNVNGNDYIFLKKELPHNQSKSINAGTKLSNKKIICVIDVDIILLNYMNIYEATKEIFKDNIDYCLPYNECVDLPTFEYRRPWGKECIGGIFVIDRNKFIESGMNDESFEGWGREDDARHEKLINLEIRFKRKYGYIIHMEHPMQVNLVDTAENNMNILNKLRNDNGNINQI